MPNPPRLTPLQIDLEAGLCNGSQGTICGFVPNSRLNLKEPRWTDFKGDQQEYQAALDSHKSSATAPPWLDKIAEPQRKNYPDDEDGYRSARQRYFQTQIYMTNSGCELLRK